MDQRRHFYKEDYATRLAFLSEQAQLTPDDHQLIQQYYSKISEQLIENYVTDFSLPLGINPNLVVNDRQYFVPMVTEEPSVIAACSNGSRLLAEKGGIQATVLSHLITGQIIMKVADQATFKQWVSDHRNELLKVANDSHPTILKYGQGAVKLSVRLLDTSYLSLDLGVDPGQSMGANIINTMLEALAAYLKDQLATDVLMSILSNYAEDCLVKVVGRVKTSRLTTMQLSGPKVANRIQEASYVAQIDSYRAATHNKGIMNGIDAVTLAFGNDNRAVASAIHSYAASNGQYRGLSQWRVDGDELVGEMTIPVPVGLVGGATKVLPMVKVNQKLSQVNEVNDLMQLIGAVGLAQNLAALKALVSDGIQKGHMNLQLKSMAMANGARPEEMAAVLTRLRASKQPSSEDVQKIIQEIRSN